MLQIRGKQMHLIRHIALAALILVPTLAQADGYLHPGLYKSAGLYLDQGDGLIANIPSHEHAEMLNQVRAFRSELATHKQQAAVEVEESRFSTKDTLLTIILPGGLLYAANRKQQHGKAQQKLSQVSQQLHEVETDLRLLQNLSSQDSISYLTHP
jgi:hypothetical protein